MSSELEIIDQENIEIISFTQIPVIEIVEIAEQGIPGASAYEVAVSNGYIGSESEWLSSLEGEPPTESQLLNLIEPLVNSAIDASYVHHQISAQTIWNINHNLNKYPSVTTVDSGNNIVYGDIHYIDLNNLSITFNSPFGGDSYLN